MKNISLAIAFLCSFLIPAHALTVADVELAPNIGYQEQTLDLYGAGIRTKYFMKLYVGSLYAVETGLDASGLLNSSQTSAIRLNIISGMITSDRMVDTVEEGFDTATQGNIEPLRQRLDTFLALFDAPIEIGDQFTFVSEPGVGVSAYKNDQKLAVVEGDDFRQALFAIWLGNKPADKKLKQGMLGK